MKIFNLLKEAVVLESSDIHITTDSLPIARAKGKFIKLSNYVLTEEDTKEMVKEIAGEDRFKIVESIGELLNYARRWNSFQSKRLQTKRKLCAGNKNN